MIQDDTIREKIRSLLAVQRLGVLSTHNNGEPYASLVAFAESDAIDTLYFATDQSSRKFRNLTQAGSAAILIDNRSNTETDFHAAAAVTAMGKVRELTDRRRAAAYDIYLAKHPYLKAFISAPSCALMALMVRRFIHVERFQDVVEFEL